MYHNYQNAILCLVLIKQFWVLYVNIVTKNIEPFFGSYYLIMQKINKYDVLDQNSRTPLMTALENCNDDIILTELINVSNCNIQNPDGNTALMMVFGKKETVSFHGKYQTRNSISTLKKFVK